MRFSGIKDPFFDYVSLPMADLQRTPDGYRLTRLTGSESMGTLVYTPDYLFPRTRDGLMDAIGYAELMCQLLAMPDPDPRPKWHLYEHGSYVGAR